MRGYRKALAPAEIAAVEDAEMNFGDIPELDEAFWRQAELVEPDLTEQNRQAPRGLPGSLDRRPKFRHQNHMVPLNLAVEALGKPRPVPCLH